MWFQKHLVIIPGAAHLRSVDVWMNASEPLRWAAVPTVLLAGVHLANIACGLGYEWQRGPCWAPREEHRTQTKAYLCSLLICLLEVSEAAGFLTAVISVLVTDNQGLREGWVTVFTTYREKSWKTHMTFGFPTLQETLASWKLLPVYSEQ